VTPTPRTADEPIIVHYDTRLTLKVEGVVQVSSHSKRLQRVHAVELVVHSTQQSRSPTLNSDNSAPVCTSAGLSLMTYIFKTLFLENQSICSPAWSIIIIIIIIIKKELIIVTLHLVAGSLYSQRKSAC